MRKWARALYQPNFPLIPAGFIPALPYKKLNEEGKQRLIRMMRKSDGFKTRFLSGERKERAIHKNLSIQICTG